MSTQQGGYVRATNLLHYYYYYYGIALQTCKMSNDYEFCYTTRHAVGNHGIGTRAKLIQLWGERANAKVA